jgi:ubiquitin-protein ligase
MNYPYAKPIAKFLNPNHIYHPLVHSKTGEINLDYEFPQWIPGKNWGVHVLLSIKKMIHLEQYYLLS